jgi:hypothetical protein
MTIFRDFTAATVGRNSANDGRLMGGHRNFLLRLLDALHESRQRQADLVIKRYAHLIDRAADRQARRADSPRPATENLGQSMRASGSTPAYRMSRTRVEAALIISALLIFGAVHVIGYSYIERAHQPRSLSDVPSHMLSAD